MKKTVQRNDTHPFVQRVQLLSFLRNNRQSLNADRIEAILSEIRELEHLEVLVESPSQFAYRHGLKS